MDSFELLVFSPPGHPDPSLAIAASRAGAIGVYDAEFAAQPGTVRTALLGLERHAKNPYGLRLGGETDEAFLAGVLDNRPAGLRWLIVDAAMLRAASKSLRAFRADGGRVLLETTRIDPSLRHAGSRMDGLIVKGCEAGGLIGERDSMALLRDALAEGFADVYVRGGAGIHTAPACFAAGARGLVLDSQMLLLDESPVAAGLRNALPRHVPLTAAVRMPDSDASVRLVNGGGCGAETLSAIGEGLVENVRALLAARAGWSDPSRQALIAGEDIGQARGLARSCGGVARALGAIRASIRAGIDAAASEPGGGGLSVATLVTSTGEAGIQQARGLMEQGLLPVVSVDPADTDSRLLDGVSGLEGGNRFGVLLDGDRPGDGFARLVAACVKAGPALAILRRGRVDQAMALSAAGLAVFLETSDPELMSLAIRSGFGRFLADAGDRGTLGAWQSAIDAIAAEVDAGAAPESLQLMLGCAADDPRAVAAALAASALLRGRGVAVSLLSTGDDSRTEPASREQTLARAGELLQAASDRLSRTPQIEPAPCDVAIVGIGCVLPGSDSQARYWQNILDRVNGVREIPRERWDWRLYFDEDRTSPDKIYSRWGGFIDDLPFDPMRFGIPPNSIAAVDPLQLMTLEVVRRTLADAGYEHRDFDRDQVSVILGASGGAGDVGAQYAVRSEMVRFTGELDPEAAQRLPTWTEDSFAGILLNVAAGRAANRFDFGGVNYTVDAACASSLTAVYQGVNELVSGRSNMAIVGGVDTVQGPFGYLCFSKTQALSPRGQCSTFDTSADGIVISEGIAMIALKRLADAERDGDRVYAVIKGAAGSSDGRAKSMTAPHPDGQIRALRRAYGQAGYSADTVGLFEAHGTGTVAGDTAELETVTRLLAEHEVLPKQTAIGSVKTLIGHTKATAGVAGLIKTALALHHRVLPPHANVTNPNAKIADPDSPLYLVSEAQPWIADWRHPRRASVSAFGFGGTNFHVTLEEYDASFLPAARPAPRQTWPAELLVFSGDTPAALASSIRDIATAFAAGARPPLRDLAYTLARRARAGKSVATLVAADPATLAPRLVMLADHIQTPSRPLPPAAFYSDEALGPDAKVAAVFSGQGAQYPNMLRELAILFPDIADTLAVADRVLAEPIAAAAGTGVRLSRLIYNTGLFNAADRDKAKADLTRTEIAQPALGALDAGAWHLLQRFGVRAHMTAGHSYGEYPALYAAGVMDLEDMLRISEERGRYIVEAADGRDLGAMAAVQATREAVQKIAADFDDLLVANHNAPLQSILSGSKRSITRAIQRLTEAGIEARELPVAAAFHSPFVAPARDRLAKAIAGLALRRPRVSVYSNTRGAVHSDDPEQLRKTLSEHLAMPVEFVAEIEAMYEAGARVFLGVGPKNIQTTLISQILGERAHKAVGIDDQEGGLKGLLGLLGTLVAEQIPLDLAPLFAGRGCRQLKLDALADYGEAEPLARHVWLLNGSGARRVGDPPATPLTVEEAAKIKAAKTAAPKENSGRAEPRKEEPRPRPSQHAPAVGLRRPREVSTMSTESPNVLGSIAPAATEGGSAMVLEGEREAILYAYQDTMRQFLKSQESVMLTYLSGGQRQGMLPARGVQPRSLAAPAPRPSAIAPRPAAVARPAPQPVAQPAPAPESAPARVNGNGAANGANASPPARAAAPAPVAVVPTPAPAPAAAPAAAPAPAAGDLDASGIKDLLLGLVEDRTGYPRDMLALDQNLEADLGIDSIKRVEIVGALVKALPPTMAAGNGELTEQLNSQTTLQGMIDRLAAGSSPQEAASGPFELTGTGTEGESCAVLSRFVMQAQRESVPEVPLEALEPGLCLIVPDAGDLAGAVASRVAAAGMEPVVVDRGALDDDQALTDAVEHARSAHGPVRALVHLAAVGAPGLDDDAPLEQWRLWTHRLDKSLYRLGRLLADDLAGGGRVVAVSGLGGRFAREPGRPWAGMSAQGGQTGFIKSLNDEWPDSGVMRAIDLDPDCDAGDNADHILVEMRLPGGRIEVGYPAGERTIFRTVATPVDPQGEVLRQPDSSWVVMATGGARGITAEVLRGIAASGLTLVLVGRTAEPDEEDPVTAALDSVSALRGQLVATARSKGASIKPVEIERSVAAILRDREIRANLADLKAAGATVVYEVADMRSEADVAALFQRVYESYGRLDGVVHGAGIIEDKLLADKDPDSWYRVYDTKVDSTRLLAAHLRPEGLRFVVFFASVAGRYGNTGQTDYATANETVTRLAWQLQRRWDGRVKVASLCWGPWLGTSHGAGMVSPETRRKFEGRGVILVPPDAGRDLFVDEVLRAPPDQVEIIAGQGPWERHESETGAWRTRPTPATTLPLIAGARQEAGDDGRIVFRHSLTRSRDRYLEEHCIDGVPVVPMAVCLELMAEAAASAFPGLTVTGMSDARALRGIKVDGDAAELRIELTPGPGDGDTRTLEARIYSVGSPLPHYRATLELADAALPLRAAQATPTPGASPVDVREAYQRLLFHGPCFQVITRLVGLDKDGCLVDTRPSDPDQWLPGVAGGQWLFDPALLDSAPQMALVWSHALDSESALPNRFGRVRRYGTGPTPACRMHFVLHTDLEAHQVRADVAFVDSDGQLRLLVEDLECSSSQALNRLGGGWKGEICV